MDALYESYFLLLTSDIIFSLIRQRFNNSGPAPFFEKQLKNKIYGSNKDYNRRCGDY